MWKNIRDYMKAKVNKLEEKNKNKNIQEMYALSSRTLYREFKKS